MAQALEDMAEVVAYVKNERLGFTIPYTIDGAAARSTCPDFIVRLDDGRGDDDLLEPDGRGVRAQARRDKEAKVATARDLWVPAVNNHGGFGRWAYIEITRPLGRRTTPIRRRTASPTPHRGSNDGRTQERRKARRTRPRWRPIDATATSAPTSPPTSCATSSPTTSAPPAKLRYPRDPSLDPQLVWKGKDEQDAADLEVAAVPIYIQEKIDPRVLVENLRRHRRGRRAEPELTLFDASTASSSSSSSTSTTTAANWSNRMILGDSLQVMASLAEKIR